MSLVRVQLGEPEQTNPNLSPIGDRFGFVFIYEYLILLQPAFAGFFILYNINKSNFIYKQVEFIRIISYIINIYMYVF